MALTGAVLGGGGLALAGQAFAATDGEWDQVARCESGGNWAINTGNGYQGGLQFSAGTWAAHGGGEFAPSANQASKDQQILVAERVLATQGRGAWPVCGRGLGAPTPRTAAAPNPAEETPAEETPAEETPVQEAAFEAPAQEAAFEAPAQEAAFEAPAQEELPAAADEAQPAATPEIRDNASYVQELWQAVKRQNVSGNDALAEFIQAPSVSI